jgi:hypothetical protein
MLPSASLGGTYFRLNAMFDACYGYGKCFINIRAFANSTDMSDQRVFGNPSSQWNNYYESPPSQTGNNSVPSSSLRANTSQFGDLASARQAVQYPATLQPGMVSRSSAAWPNSYRNSNDPGERALAGAVISTIQNGSLALGNPASQSATRAQYGQRLETTHGTVLLVVNFKTRTDERFDLVAASMRDTANQNRRVTITAPQNASISGQPQPIPNPAPLLPSAPPQFPVQPSPTPGAGPSSQPLQPVVAPPVFSAQISRSIKQIVNGLSRWEQQAARTQIETRLRSAPANEQQTLLMHLTTQLSGKASDAKPATIQNWAATTSVASATEGRDMRTDHEREMQTALTAQLNNPAFRKLLDEILDLLPRDQKRKSMDINIIHGGTYKSLLYRRVFADSRGPVAAITDIHALIEPLPEQQRYQAIKDWVPR